MASFETGELPVLSETEAQQYDEPLDSKFQRLVSRTQSASISIPMSAMESYERETSLVGQTGPLWSARKPPFMQMSGPLYTTPGAGKKVEESKTENFATFRSTGSNYWNNNHERKNEHLWKSGQLGMCSDPYCTTCPTYFKASQLRNPKASSKFDPKVSAF